MIINVAKTAGFCFGVDRAVKLVYKLLESGEKIATLGPIIHNPQVIDDLQAKGVKIINASGEVEPGYTVVIRAHGVSPTVITELEKAGINYIDATCPFVTKIHKIVAALDSKSTILLIAGDENHPEVQGFAGEFKGEKFVFSSCEEFERIVKEYELESRQTAIVAQTTFSKTELEKIKKIYDKVLKNGVYYDTICVATQKRQDEAEQLARRSDAMIVIGGRFSSNTVKLKSVCDKFCPAFLVEQASELQSIDFSPYNVIGITAGASTPASIIKEGVTFMTNENEILTTNEGEKFAGMLEDYLYDSQAICDGVVLEVSPTEIQLDIGRKFTAFIPAVEYSWEPNVDLVNEVQVGDHIKVLIMKTDENECTIKVSKRRADSELAFEKIKEAFEAGTVLDAKVSEIRNSGVIVYPFGGRVFIPYTQAGLSRGASLASLEGKDVQFKILSIDEEKKRSIGSIRIITEEAQKAAMDAFWADAEVGKVYTGKVTSVVPYGAFVDLGGVEALLHKSEISYKRINNVADVLHVGDEIEVKVIKLEESEDGKRRISVSSKKEEDLPWPTFVRTCEVGDIVKIKVMEFKTFGAIVRLVDYHLRGLVHIKEVANHYVEDIAKELSIGQVLDAQITVIDTEKHRINLSIRALLPDEDKVTMADAFEKVELDEEAIAAAEAAAKEAEEAAKDAADAAKALESAAAVETDSVFGALVGDLADDVADAIDEAKEVAEKAAELAAEEAVVEQAVEAAVEAAEETSENAE